MLNSITFKKDWRCFKKDQTIEFRPGINLIVGDQGCGKSSIFTILSAPNRHDDVVKIDAEPCGFFFFDFEKMNPRAKNRIDNGFDAISHFKSHGEINLSILKKIKEEKSPSLFLMDEPDMALSIRSIVKLIKLFKSSAKDGHQLIVSAHNPFLIQAFKDVLSLEHKMWMTSDSFIDSHLGKKRK